MKSAGPNPDMPPKEHLPEAVLALRTERERAFCWHYMLNGANGTQAALSAGYPNGPAGQNTRQRAHELLMRPDVQTALRELCQKYLFSLAPKALFKLKDLLESDNERVAAKAVEMTLNRTGFADRHTMDVNVNGEVRVVDHTSAAVDDLRRLKSLGVPQEELQRVFGFSGLSRYEKLLAAADAKLIEGQVVENG